MMMLARAAVVTGAVVLLIGGTGAVAAEAPNTLPPHVTKVSVHAGRTTAHVDAALTSASAIAGAVTDESSNPLASAEVFVVTPTGRTVGEGFTDSSGAYRVISLPPTTRGYAVCVLGTAATSTAAPVSYGYVSQCNGSSAVWMLGARPPSDARLIDTQVNQTETANFGLPDAGAVTGAVTSRADGGTLTNAYAYLYTLSGHSAGEAPMGDTTYTITGVTPGTYRVCFDPPNTATAKSPGYLPQCFHHTAWTDSSKPPAKAAKVTVAADAATTVDQSLPVSGAITGSVRTATKPPHALPAAIIVTYSHDKSINTTFPGRNGIYRLQNLPAGTIKVCAFHSSLRLVRDVRSALRRHETGFGARRSPSVGGRPDAADIAADQLSSASGQCWQGVAWSGRGAVPKAARPVRVQLGKFTAGIDFRLSRVTAPSAIRGRVTGPAGGPVARATVVAFRRSGADVAEASTNKHGRYRLGVPASPKSGYFVCVAAPYGRLVRTAASAQHLGSRCWKNTGWTGTRPPKTGRVVKVARGHVRKGIDVKLPSAGQIAGTVTFEGQPVPNVEVIAFDAAQNFVSVAFAADDGTYTLPDISPLTHGYEVCFTTQQTGATTLNPDYGFRPQCFNGQVWDGSGS
jgi:hypothetical protein